MNNDERRARGVPPIPVEAYYPKSIDSDPATTDVAVVEQAAVELVNPVTGELVPAGDVAKIAEALADVRQLRDRLNDASAAFTAMVAAEAERQGTKTLTAGAWTVRLGADTEIEWDIEILVELLTAGLPVERYDQLVKTVVTHKVDGRIVRQIEAASPTYAAIIDRARVRVPKRQYASVERTP